MLKFVTWHKLVVDYSGDICDLFNSHYNASLLGTRSVTSKTVKLGVALFCFFLILIVKFYLKSHQICLFSSSSLITSLFCS